MWTISDLGRKLKKENPGRLDHLTDEQVGRAAKRAAAQKGSNEYDMYDDTSLTIHQPRNVMSNPANYDALIKSTWDKVDPEIGGIIAIVRKWKAESQNEYYRELNKQQLIFIEKAEALAKSVARGVEREAALRLFVTQHQAQIIQIQAVTHIVQKAAEKGMTLETYQKWKLHEQEMEEKRKRDEAKYNLEELREQMAHERREKEKESEHRRAMEKKRQEDESEIAFAFKELEFALIADHLTSYQQRIIIQNFIDQQYREINEIKLDLSLDKEVREQMIESRMNLIRSFEELRDEKATTKRLQENHR